MQERFDSSAQGAYNGGHHRKEAPPCPSAKTPAASPATGKYKLPWGSDENDPRCRKLQQQLFDAVDAVYAAGIRHFICGMANGCDLYFFDAARYLRLQHPEVTIEAAIPFAGQADRWRPELRERYAYDLRQCDYQTLVQEAYTPRVHDAPQPLHGRCLAHPHRGI